jgi:hypothetical protein
MSRHGGIDLIPLWACILGSFGSINYRFWHGEGLPNFMEGLPKSTVTLRIISGPHKDEEFVLGMHQSMVIGRAADDGGWIRTPSFHDTIFV